MNIIPQFLRWLKHKVEGFAQKPYSTWILFALAFIESSLVPIAPDLLLIPLAVARPKRSLFYAFICVLGSTIGALLGYFIGFELYGRIGEPLVGFFGWGDLFNSALDKYHEHGWTVLLFAGFTPIPFQVFTLVAGFKQTVDLRTFVLATLAGRSLRFFLLGGILFVFGPSVKEYLDNNLERFTLIVGLLLAAWILVMRFVF